MAESKLTPEESLDAALHAMFGPARVRKLKIDHVEGKTVISSVKLEVDSTKIFSFGLPESADAGPSDSASTTPATVAKPDLESAEPTPPDSASTTVATIARPDLEEVEHLIDKKDLAKRLKIGLRTLDGMISSRKIPAPIRPSNRIVRWRAEEIEDWIREGCPDRATWELRLKSLIKPMIRS